MKISEHISYLESIHSHTAKVNDINNKPNKEEVDSMKAIAENIFEPLRKYVGGPIKINSFFRSKELNKKIKGSLKSQHCKGEAIDIDDIYGHKTNAEMYYYIKNNLDFDQLIWEFGDDKNPDWVHVSYSKNRKNKKRCLKSSRLNKKTIYNII